MAAVTVLVGVHLLAVSARSFLVFNLSLVICWIAFALILVGEHRKAVQYMNNLA